MSNKGYGMPGRGMPGGLQLLKFGIIDCFISRDNPRPETNHSPGTNGSPCQCTPSGRGFQKKCNAYPPPIAGPCRCLCHTHPVILPR